MSRALDRAPDWRLERPATERLKVHEIYYTLQGESSRAGRPCVMVRLTGCQMRCVWCDSEHSFYEGVWRTLDEVLAEVGGHRCPLVEVTGGEPLLQPGCRALLERLCADGYEVLLETGGGVSIDGVDPRVRRIVDVKCPGSGEVENNHWPNLEQLRSRDELKFVVADRRDYEWARDLVARRRLDEICPVFLSPVSGAVRPEELAGWMLADCFPGRLQLQLHKILWGDRRGV